MGGHGFSGMNAAAVTAITNFLLAGETLFLAGMLVRKSGARYSAAWFWGRTFVLIGVSALLGGIDHGFFETAGLDRSGIKHLNWLVIGAATFCMLLTTATQFLSARAQRAFLAVGIIQFVAYAVAVFAVDRYAIVILNYGPVLLLLLAVYIARARTTPGATDMIAGIVILVVASAVQALGVNTFAPLNSSGLYHVVSMAGMIFLYRGGRLLRDVRS